MAYQLAVLRDTQMVQRRQLEAMYPYIDWEKMPFSSYGDFFRLRGILDDCGAVWTNAYGRSNEEAEDTRKYLMDYCFHKENGYAFDWSRFQKGSNSQNVNFSYDADTGTMTVTGIENKEANGVSFYVNLVDFYPATVKYEVRGLKPGESFQIRKKSLSGIIDIVVAEASGEGIHTLTTPRTNGLLWGVYGVTDTVDRTITIRQLPGYRIANRDIELFNFGWSGGSGYGLYLFNWSSGWSVNNSGSAGLDVVATSSKMSFNVTSDYAPNFIGLYKYTSFAKKVLTVRISGMRTGEKAGIAFNKGNGDEVQIYIYNDGTMKVTLDDTIRALAISVSNITDKSNRHIVIEQIPEYPGALVGDGVDDYGQCVADFALPDDYTVVAMREILTPNSCLASKIMDAQNGAFCMELFGNSTISYGTVNNSVPPKLFSYQTRVSYNGSSINSGTSGDGNTNKLMLFKRPLDTPCSSVALYSFGIFNRTLTEDELRIVENCMYAEWIAMTGKLEDIEYYDILDARFRSNDEDADKRNRWVGRFGKLHMTLLNYAYSQMSGWDGYKDSIIYGMTPNFSGIAPATKTGNTIRWIYPYTSDIYLLRTGGRDEFKFTVYIKGVTRAISSGILQEIRFRTRMRTATQIDTVPIKKDGIYNISLPVTSETVYLGVVSQPLKQENFPEPIIITQIPDYPGALVSDGVDDHAVSDEVIDEEIGGFVCHAEAITKGYVFASGWGNYDVFLYRIENLTKGGNATGNVETTEPSNSPFIGFSKSPLIPNEKLSISPSMDLGHGQSALYQLRLIKNQPTDVQLEAIKWQCRKEHDDYLIHMGWKEVE